MKPFPIPVVGNNPLLSSIKPRCWIPAGKQNEGILEHLVWSASWLRDAERAAAATQNITLSELMVRAGEAAYDVFHAAYPASKHWLILVGTGNNGGDGYVIARKALKDRIKVTVAAMPVTKEMPEEATNAKAAYNALKNGPDTILSESWEVPPTVDVIVDGLLGTGLTGAPHGLCASVIEKANQSKAARVAIDIPSGLNAETGEAVGPCFRADITVTFICLKPGLITGQARDYVGELHYNSLKLGNFMLTPAIVQKSVCNRIGHADLPLYFGAIKRPSCSHKGTNGRVLLVGGDSGFGGAIILAAEAAIASGAGLVRVITRPEHLSPLLCRVPEVMVTTFSTDAELEAALSEGLDWSTCAAVGPGLGRKSFGVLSLNAFLTYGSAHVEKTFVFDADALNLISEHYITPNKPLPSLPSSIITPHPGEAARLLQSKVAELEADRLGTANKLCELLHGVALLKGPGTIVQGYRGKPTVVDAGNAGMASGGMGDLLTGTIAGVAAQTLFDNPEANTCAAALAHSVAADLYLAVTSGKGVRGLAASQIVSYINDCVNAKSETEVLQL